MAKSKSSGAAARSMAMKTPSAPSSKTMSVAGGYKVPSQVDIGKSFDGSKISREDFKSMLDTFPDGTIYNARGNFRTWRKQKGEWILESGPESSLGKAYGKESLADNRNASFGIQFSIGDARKEAEWRKKYKK